MKHAKPSGVYYLEVGSERTGAPFPTEQDARGFAPEYAMKYVAQGRGDEPISIVRDRDERRETLGTCASFITIDCVRETLYGVNPNGARDRRDAVYYASECGKLLGSVSEGRPLQSYDDPLARALMEQSYRRTIIAMLHHAGLVNLAMQLAEQWSPANNSSAARLAENENRNAGSSRR
jgi:hypothetical protein